MPHSLIDAMERQAVVPALKDPAQLDGCLTCPGEVIFLLCGDILNIETLLRRLHEAGKKVIVHADLVAGLASKEIAVDFLQRCGADGIISTRPHLVRRSRELGLLSVLRVFIIDSKAMSNLRRESEDARPDAIEVLPGAMPQVIERLSREIRVPLIAGGLLNNKADILAALGAGARCVSTSDSHLWAL